MPRITRTYSRSVPITTPILLLPYNADRVMYSLQNLDAGNYIAYSSNPNVAAAGTATANEGFHVVAGQIVSDDMDVDRIFAVANTAAVIVTITEIVDANPRTGSRQLERESRRSGSRSFV